MTKPQIEFIGCNPEEMRAHFEANASNVLPFSNRCARPVNNAVRKIQDKTVTATEEILYFNGNRKVVAWIVRITYENEEPVDFPILFQFRNTVYVCTNW